MNLQKFNFPKPNMCIKTDPRLLKEAKKRGFYPGNISNETEYNKLFSNLFFNGGELNFKKDLNETFFNKAFPYLKAFIGSFEPKHEEKEAICAMLLSELVNIK